MGGDYWLVFDWEVRRVALLDHSTNRRRLQG